MKIYIFLLLVAQGVISPVFAVEHLKESKSPLLVNQDGKEVWIPNSYGGVAAVTLNLDEVGTDNMLQVYINGSNKLIPFYGKSFKIHSDKTVEDKEKKSTIRTVALIKESSHENDHYVEVVHYRIIYREARNETHYHLTFSAIRNNYEVSYLVPFTGSTPPSYWQTEIKNQIENQSH